MDKRTQVEGVAKTLGSSYLSVSTIKHVRLGKRKLTVRFVPKFLDDKNRSAANCYSYSGRRYSRSAIGSNTAGSFTTVISNSFLSP